ncbi:MAG: hypothetical protein MHM6MM_007282 [Cercozoa sp. M6MM]
MPFVMKDDKPSFGHNQTDRYESLMDEATEKTRQIVMLEQAMRDIIQNPEKSTATAAQALGFLKVWHEDHTLKTPAQDEQPWHLDIRLGKHSVDVRLQTPGRPEPEVVHRTPKSPDIESAIADTQEWIVAYRDGLRKAAPKREVEIALEPIDPAPPDNVSNIAPLAPP